MIDNETRRNGTGCNDEAADDYEADQLGAHRGVLDLTVPDQALARPDSFVG